MVFTQVWLTASLLKSSELFKLFKLILTATWSGWPYWETKWSGLPCHHIWGTPTSSLFWSHDKVNWRICLFHEQDFRNDSHFTPQQQAHQVYLHYLPDPRRGSDFHFLLYELVFMFLEHIVTFSKLGTRTQFFPSRFLY